MFTKEMDKFTYRNNPNETMRLIRVHVLNRLIFYLDGCDTPKQILDKLASLFGKVNKFRALQLGAEFPSLVPDEHASIEDYLAKFRSLLAQLKGCRKTKSNDECIFLILSKLKESCEVFSSAFYSTMDALGVDFKIPTFELFCEFLTR